MHSVLALAVLKLALRLELGPEYDSNANRAEVIVGQMPQTGVTPDVPQGSFLLRTTILGQLVWRTQKNALRLSAGIGGKVFFSSEVQDQNTLVGQVAIEDRIRLAQPVSLAFAGDYYDASQQTVDTSCSLISCDRHRDFRSGTLASRLGFHGDGGDLTLAGSYRGFQWKPDPAFNFQSGAADLIAVARFTVGPPEREHEIDLAASYHAERRFYEGLLEVNACPPGMLQSSCIQNGNGTRADWFHEGTLELTWVTRVLVALGYALQFNQSNSFGQSLLRNVITLKLAARLPWQLYLTLKGQLLINKYLDPVLLDSQVNSQTFVSIEDENRNAVIVDLERPITKIGLSVSARYSLYTNELSQAPVSFIRHVIYLGLSYKVGTK